MLSGVHCESLKSIWPCLSACCICFLKYWACYNKEFCITLFSWAFACACVWVSSYRGPNSSLSTPRTFCYQSCCCSPPVGNSVYFILIIFFSLPGCFFVVGSFLVSVSLLLGSPRKRIRMRRKTETEVPVWSLSNISCIWWTPKNVCVGG